MLTEGRGARGVYERIRTDLNVRVELCRPDVASEYLWALLLFRKTGRTEYDDVFENVTRWLVYAQNDRKKDKNNAFPFYLTGGEKGLPKMKRLYQNDNGKVLVNLCRLYEETGDERFVTMAKKSADFWVGVQKRNGVFFKRFVHLKKNESEGPCFILWLMTGLFSLSKITGEEKYAAAGRKAFAAARRQIKEGRMRTSFEIGGAEAWRPVSSENHIALLCFALSYRYTGDKVFIDAIQEISPFCDRLVDEETGAVKNSDGSAPKASLNNSETLCDFVYTQGYAFLAMIELYKVLGDKKYLDRASKAAAFAIETQLSEGDPKTDGAWRGSYDIRTKKAEGRCNQRNSLDEGGKYSVYTGWCALPITAGLLSLYLMEKTDGEK